MGYPVKLAASSRPIAFEMYLSGTNTPATGKTVTVTLSKNGAAFGSSVANTEVGNGGYKLNDPAAAADTLGVLKLYATASGCDPTTETFEVVAYDPHTATNLGLSDVAAVKAKTDNLPSDPADASDIAAALVTLSAYVDTEVAAIKAKTDQLTFTIANKLDVNLTALWGQTTISPGDKAPNL